jgi:ABC-type lipoprotein export system ATPase subunit
MRSLATGARAAESGATMTAEPLVHCDNLVKIFQRDSVEVVALQGLDLAVEAGEMTAVVGASGSGKSTLLNILSGQEVPTAGKVRVAGEDLLTMRSRQRRRYRRHRVGFVWQQAGRNLLPYLTAEQNVMLPMALAHTRSRQARQRAAELLELVGVEYCARRKPAEMSGGEQQRTAVAVGLANRPSLLLADEPTGELDTDSGLTVFAAMQAANRDLGVTVVVVTHDALVSDQVTRTVAIRDGRTASEMVRRSETDAEGTDRVIAEEYAVLDRVGRLQLPSEFTEALGLRNRVRLELEPDHVGVWPDRSRRVEAEEHDGA